MVIALGVTLIIAALVVIIGLLYSERVEAESLAQTVTKEEQ